MNVGSVQSFIQGIQSFLDLAIFPARFKASRWGCNTSASIAREAIGPWRI
jgi:hypothetical protein